MMRLPAREKKAPAQPVIQKVEEQEVYIKPLPPRNFDQVANDKAAAEKEKAKKEYLAKHNANGGAAVTGLQNTANTFAQRVTEMKGVAVKEEEEESDWDDPGALVASTNAALMQLQNGAVSAQQGISPVRAAPQVQQLFASMFASPGKSNGSSASSQPPSPVPPRPETPPGTPPNAGDPLLRLLQ